MPTFVRYYIKTALAYFLLSLLAGILLAVEPIVELPSAALTNFATYLHLFVVGWITQLIFGVSIWMFPSPETGGRYGNETVVWSIYWTLNLGLFLRLLAEPGKQIFFHSTLVNWGLLVSAGLQWTAGVLYAYHIWGRVQD